MLDGGLASELEFHGACIDGPLWSAHVLEDAPEKINAVHRAYIEAGTGCILTASYQVSRMSYAEAGFGAERAGEASTALRRTRARICVRRPPGPSWCIQTPVKVGMPSRALGLARPILSHTEQGPPRGFPQVRRSLAAAAARGRSTFVRSQRLPPLYRPPSTCLAIVASCIFDVPS